MRKNTGVSKIRSRIQVRADSTFNTMLHDEKIIRRYIVTTTLRNDTAMAIMKLLVERIVLHQKLESSHTPRRGAILFAHKLFFVIRSRQANFLPIEIMGATIRLLLQFSTQHNDLQSILLVLCQLEGARLHPGSW